MKPPFDIPRRLVAPLRILYDAYVHFSLHDGFAIASHIALSTLISMFPFLIFLTALAGFLHSQDLADAAARSLFDTWPVQVAGPVTKEIHNVLTQSHGDLLTLGIGLSVYFSSNGVEALRVGLNRAYARQEYRPWWQTRLESIAFVVFGALAALALGFLVVLAPLLWHKTVELVPLLAPLHNVVTVTRFALAGLVTIVALVLLHACLPAARLKIRDLAAGIALTFVLWIGSAYVFGAYLATFARNYTNTYAGLASVMIALGFLYMIGAIFIFGGEFNAAVLRARQRRTADPAPLVAAEEVR